MCKRASDVFVVAVCFGMFTKLYRNHAHNNLRDKTQVWYRPIWVRRPDQVIVFQSRTDDRTLLVLWLYSFPERCIAHSSDCWYHSSHNRPSIESIPSDRGGVDSVDWRILPTLSRKCTAKSLAMCWVVATVDTWFSRQLTVDHKVLSCQCSWLLCRSSIPYILSEEIYKDTWIACARRRVQLVFY